MRGLAICLLVASGCLQGSPPRDPGGESGATSGPPRVSTRWYPNGNKEVETRVNADGVTESTRYYESGTRALWERTRNGKRDGKSIEWFENGQKKHAATYRDNKLVAWNGWSPDGTPLTGAACADDVDCIARTIASCYPCSPSYEAITRWQAAEREIHPPPALRCKDPGPFACAPPPPAPTAACRASRCVLVDARSATVLDSPDAPRPPQR